MIIAVGLSRLRGPIPFLGAQRHPYRQCGQRKRRGASRHRLIFPCPFRVVGAAPHERQLTVVESQEKPGIGDVGRWDEPDALGRPVRAASDLGDEVHTVIIALPN